MCGVGGGWVCGGGTDEVDGLHGGDRLPLRVEVLHLQEMYALYSDAYIM